MKFGVNLSFCVKRWVTPELWAPLVRDRLKLDCVQFSFDLVDPLWPDDVLADLAAELRAVPDRHGITIHSAFIGLAHYTFNQLLHPKPRVRDFAEAWLTRAYRFAAKAGIARVGGPAGAIASRADGNEASAIPEADYADLIARLQRLSGVAAASGIEELYIEPTPMRREWPWTIQQARQMLADLSDSEVPWRLCIDWGHATIAPLYGHQQARMDSWFAELGSGIGIVHLQQTDGILDRHWDFTQPGIVDPCAAASQLRRYGLGGCPVFLEVFYPFERTDAAVLDGMERSSALLRNGFV